MMMHKSSRFKGSAPFGARLLLKISVLVFGCIVVGGGGFEARADSGETETDGVVPTRKPTPAEQKRYMKLFTQGNAFLYRAEYVPAIAHFLSAIKIAPDLPGAWRQLGLAYEGHRDYEEAIKAYDRYLSIAGGTGKFSVQVMKRINVCREALGLPPRQFEGLLQGPPGEVEIKTSTKRAMVRINNVRRGRTPVKPLRLRPGSHTLTLTKRGYLPWSTTLMVYPGERVVVETDLVKDPNYVPEPKVKDVKRDPRLEMTKGGLKVNVALDQHRVLLNGAELQKNEKGVYVLKPGRWVVDVIAPGRVSWRKVVEIQKGRQRILEVPHLDLKAEVEARRYNRRAWIWFGTATVLGGAGMMFGLLQNRAHRQIRDGGALSDSALLDLEDKRKTYGALSWTAYGMGAAALISSAVLFIMKRRVESLPLRTGSVGVSPMGGGVGVSYSGEVNFP